MLLTDSKATLDAVKKSSQGFLAIKNPENDDYIQVEKALRDACLTALVGTNEYFYIDAIVSKVSMDKALMQILTRIEDKQSFRSFCKQALGN